MTYSYCCFNSGGKRKYVDFWKISETSGFSLCLCLCPYVLGKEECAQRRDSSQGIPYSLTVKLCGTVWSPVVSLSANICFLKVLVDFLNRNCFLLVWRKAEASLNIGGRTIVWEGWFCSRKGQVNLVGEKIWLTGTTPSYEDTQSWILEEHLYLSFS